MKKVLPVIVLFCFYACETPPVDPVILGAEEHLVGKVETLTQYLEGEKLNTQTFNYNEAEQLTKITTLNSIEGSETIEEFQYASDGLLCEDFLTAPAARYVGLLLGLLAGFQPNFLTCTKVQPVQSRFKQYIAKM